MVKRIATPSVKARHFSSDPVRHETPRTRGARVTDHAGMSRPDKINALVRMELWSLGNGDPAIGKWAVHPTRIIEAVDAGENLPPSGMYVRRPRTAAELVEARELRAKRWAELSEDERVVRMSINDACSGTDSYGRWRLENDDRIAAARASDRLASGGVWPPEGED